MPTEIKILEAPRWLRGPLICNYANLPAFKDEAEVKAFFDKTLGSYLLKWTCKSCCHIHCWPKPYAPAGGSSGTTREYKIPDYVYELAGIAKPVEPMPLQPIRHSPPKL